MKDLLIVAGGVCLLAGVVGALYTLTSTDMFMAYSQEQQNARYILAGAYGISGLFTSLLFFAQATILHKLEALGRRG